MLEYTKGASENRQYNGRKKKIAKRQTTIYKTQHSKQYIDTNLTKSGVNSDASEGEEVRFVDHILEGCNEVWFSRL